MFRIVLLLVDQGLPEEHIHSLLFVVWQISERAHRFVQ